MNKRVMLCLLSLAAFTAWQAQAQAVWRCGADGRSFSDRPCSNGQPLQMAELADPRSSAEVQAGLEVATRDRQLADRLRHERLDRERLSLAPSRHHAPAPRTATVADVRPKPDPMAQRTPARRQSQRRQPADDGIWRAVAPSSRHAKD